jgi:serine/threonine protein kinase
MPLYPFDLADLIASRASSIKPFSVPSPSLSPTSTSSTSSTLSQTKYGMLTEDEVVHLSAQLCTALHHLHHRRVVYRNCHPAKVLLQPPLDSVIAHPISPLSLTHHLY